MTFSISEFLGFKEEEILIVNNTKNINEDFSELEQEYIEC